MNAILSPSAEDTSLDVSILRPLLEDQPLMCLIKSRYVPFSFVLKKVHKKPTAESSLEVANALIALKPGNSHAAHYGVVEMDANFTLIQGILHVGGGRQVGRQTQDITGQITLDMMKKALSHESREAGRVFGEKHYDPLKKYHLNYEKVLRECERSSNLKEAQLRAKVDDEEFGKIKGFMSRFGLVRDIAFAKTVLVDGPIIKEIEQRYLGERVEDVVLKMLRAALNQSEASAHDPGVHYLSNRD